jgi:AcrR family transcriptional regulator
MTDATATRARARPLPPDDRRAALIEQVIPLLKERGRDVSSRDIAEACGVAEGTIFRAFGDKDSLIAAAVEAYFDPEPFRRSVAAIDRGQPAEEKVRQLLGLLRERFSGILGLMTAMRLTERPPNLLASGAGEWVAVVEDLFAPDVASLTVPPATLAHYLRLVAFGTAIPHFNALHDFGEDELRRLVAHGVLRQEG